MKILHIIGNLDKKLGGTYSALHSIMVIENSLGHYNEVLFTRTEGQQIDKEYFKDKVHLVERSFPKRFRFSKQGIEWLRQNINSYDLVVIHEIWGGLAVNAATVANELGVKYIIWPHGSLDPFDLQKKNFLKKILGKMVIGKMVANAESICCTSDLEKTLLETYNGTPKNIEVLPLPIDYNGKGNPENFRNKYSLGKDSFVFLFLSRIDYKKGLDVFLIALSNYLQKYATADIKVVMAGSGTEKYKDLIKQIVLDKKLSNYIIDAGFLSGNEKADALAGANCFILTSMNENYGISTIEALQAGLPVLISNNIYIWERIVPEGGWVCDYSVSSIEKSIEEIIGYSGQPKKEPAKVGQQFSTASLLVYYKNFYNSLN
jgi:glycosyltransferase involved in cell wall biosynthesis